MKVKEISFASNKSKPMYKRDFNPVTFKLHIFEDKAGEWRWNMAANNGRIVADSAEGYKTKWGCKRAARKFLGL